MRRRHFLALPAAAGALPAAAGALPAAAGATPAAGGAVPAAGGALPAAGGALPGAGAAFLRAAESKPLFPGVWKFTLGSPEKITPVATGRYGPAENGFASLPEAGACPVTVSGAASKRGYLVSIPLDASEMVYGLGLQLQSFAQRGMKKKLRVNADPVMDSGDTHAPVPFYVSTRGYGVLIDTARYATYYCGGKVRKSRGEKPAGSELLAEVPEAEGVEVYVFGGPSMRAAVQRYNLFSGGGPLPPRWGLGMWYRVEKDFTQDEVLKFAEEFRRDRIPCDVIGLEPGWQTHAYSCSFVWSGKFPDPGGMVKKLAEGHYRLNLWEHAFTHPSSPIYDALFPRSGDYEVWGGLAPDFLDAEARRIFGGFHEKEHVALGVSGYKLDECDNSDFTRNWSFPEVSRFPSGADGEQMHCVFGQRYQDAIQEVFDRRKTRTYGLVRSSGALAAPYPYVLYSDLYDHTQFIRGLVNSGFTGLLWTPELRDAKNAEDLIRRLQSVVMSPMALINAWYIRNPPWKQVRREENNAGRFDPDWREAEARCRAIMELRMRLVPYLHAAFVRYHREGLPPFRALVMDYPDDEQTWRVDNQYMMGEALLVAPVVAGRAERKVYLPAGGWFDFWSGKRFDGKQSITVRPPLEHIPVFVREGAILPLADPTLHTDDPGSWRLIAQVYGNRDASASVYEDDGSFEPSLREVRLRWDAARRAGAAAPGAARYQVAGWKLFE